MTLNEKDLQLFQKWLKSHLAVGKVTVTFTKKDGEERVMECTTSPSLVPPSPVVEGAEPKREKKKNNDICSVYALDVNAWRSFRWDSIKVVSFTFGEELEYSDET
jgi:hypothetical protein